MDKRHKGFVIGSDRSANGLVWKVRIKDPTSDYDGKKLIVASVHDEITLAKGLNVSFIIGTIDGREAKEKRAVDVRLEC